jgi:hypothetical protein
VVAAFGGFGLVSFNGGLPQSFLGLEETSVTGNRMELKDGVNLRKVAFLHACEG